MEVGGDFRNHKSLPTFDGNYFLTQMTFSMRRLVVPVLVLVLFLDLCVETGLSHSTPAREEHVHHHGGGCSSHSHDHDHDHHEPKQMKLPEELAEEEDMRLCGFGPCLHHNHDHDHLSSSALSGFGNLIFTIKLNF